MQLKEHPQGWEKGAVVPYDAHIIISLLAPETKRCSLGYCPLISKQPASTQSVET